MRLGGRSTLLELGDGLFSPALSFSALPLLPSFRLSQDVEAGSMEQNPMFDDVTGFGGASSALSSSL